MCPADARTRTWQLRQGVEYLVGVTFGRFMVAIGAPIMFFWDGKELGKKPRVIQFFAATSTPRVTVVEEGTVAGSLPSSGVTSSRHGVCVRRDVLSAVEAGKKPREKGADDVMTMRKLCAEGVACD
ncbi:hypothetical protein PR202_ga26300 [Eleusine coracana subsp. coracana]|uniref:Uncharacterized protein n=1 Tax=Eleusine coracana subsp. coracana TaxID=191504 RepID=A0AAV5DCW7_ELECO|nr:hypothetical protein PR202_ga26300 [Eleusine coracana subsp. coracana]